MTGYRHWIEWRHALRGLHHPRQDEPTAEDLERALRAYADLQHAVAGDVEGSDIWLERDAAIWADYFATVQRIGPKRAWAELIANYDHDATFPRAARRPGSSGPRT
jgi:hypothetical protein